MSRCALDDKEVGGGNNDGEETAEDKNWVVKTSKKQCDYKKHRRKGKGK